MSSLKVHINADEPQDRYVLSSDRPVPAKKKGTIRVWVDGCFDMMHFGHANALRQAAALGDELFVGCHSDAEIMQFKGPPVMHEEERYAALRACKWVTYLVENYPYCTRLKDIERLEVDFVVHGDDISVGLDGKNSYQEIIDAGRFKVVKRTDGISTTDLVGRMLLCTKNHFNENSVDSKLEAEFAGAEPVHYLTTSRKISQFSNNTMPSETDKVVYVDGSFDLFHVGHIAVLQKARQFGTYVIVGIHDDNVVNQIKGVNYPIMNLHERVLGVLSCRYVDEVVMGVPFCVTKEVIDRLHIDIVVSGKVCDAYNAASGDQEELDPYKLPRELGIYREVDSSSDLNTDKLIERVMENRAKLLKRQAEKLVKNKKGEEQKPEEYKHVREVN